MISVGILWLQKVGTRTKIPTRNDEFATIHWVGQKPFFPSTPPKKLLRCWFPKSLQRNSSKNPLTDRGPFPPNQGRPLKMPFDSRFGEPSKWSPKSPYNSARPHLGRHQAFRGLQKSCFRSGGREAGEKLGMNPVFWGRSWVNLGRIFVEAFQDGILKVGETTEFCLELRIQTLKKSKWTFQWFSLRIVAF